MMKFLLVPFALVVATSVAHTEDTFEAKAAGATRVRHIDDLIWAFTATCEKGDDAQQRQCRHVRDQRVKELAGATLLVDGDADAFDVGRWNADKKSVPVRLSACVRCDGVAIEGRSWYVVGAPAPRVEGGKVRAAFLHDNARPFSDEAAAAAWTKTIKNVKVELIVKVPDHSHWQISGKDGLLLDVVGYRVITPCDGEILLASPSSSAVKPDRRKCERPAAPADQPPSDSLPVSVLTPAMVQEAMRPVVDAANDCFEHYGVAGSAKLAITIADDGTVVKFDQTGDFDNTPTGQCIDTAMKQVQFPKSKKARTKIGYPIVLQ